MNQNFQPKQRPQRPKQKPNIFDLYKNQFIKIQAKTLPDGTVFIYEGILFDRGQGFIFLKDGSVYKISPDGKKTLIEHFDKIGINTNIIAIIYL